MGWKLSWKVLMVAAVLAVLAIFATTTALATNGPGRPEPATSVQAQSGPGPSPPHRGPRFEPDNRSQVPLPQVRSHPLGLQRPSPRSSLLHRGPVSRPSLDRSTFGLTRPSPTSHSLHPRPLFGTVKEKSPAGDYFILARGEREVKVLVNGTKYHVPGVDEATFADVNVYARVVVFGHRVDGDFTAKRVIVAQGKALQRLLHARMRGVVRTGEVTAFASDSITVSGFQGAETTTFQITDNTRTRLPDGQAEPAIGERVRVIGRFDREQGKLIAVRIAVLPVRPPPP